MRVVDNKVQLLCPIASSFRVRRPFKPFSSPVAVTSDRVRHTDNASSAVLSTADSMHITNTRPLQEQLRDQMDLHKLQREPVPEDTSDAESVPSQQSTGAGRPKRGRPSNKVQQAPERKGEPSRRRNERRSSNQSDEPKTVAKKAARAARFGRAQHHKRPEEQAPEPTPPEPKHPCTLSKQEDVALCSAIKANTVLLHTTSIIAPACCKCNMKSCVVCRIVLCITYVCFDATVIASICLALHGHCNQHLCPDVSAHL